MKHTNLFLSILATIVPLSVVAQEAVGTVKSLRGDTQIERSGSRRTAKLGESLFEQDRLITGADGHASLGLRDQSVIAIGPRADVDLSKYRFNPTTHSGEQAVRVRSGTLAAISGKVAKANPQAVQFNTGTVTLGVRGTQFLMEVQPEINGKDAALWTDSQQRVIRSGFGLCWQTSAGLDARSDCQPTRFVLLPDRDSSVGRLVIERTAQDPQSSIRANGRQIIWVDAAFEGVEMDDNTLRPVSFNREQIRARYQTVLDALPPAPQTFTVRFTSGRSDQLTPESEAMLVQAREALTRWPVPPDVDVVGHTDTTGVTDSNDKLSRERAQTVARWLNAPPSVAERIYISGRGERQLLVSTPDETDEPANRRVEITVY